MNMKFSAHEELRIAGGSHFAGLSTEPGKCVSIVFYSTILSF